MMKLFTTFTLSLSLFSLAGCNSETSAVEPTSSSQTQEICVIDQSFELSKCQTGQNLFFQPSTFGNEQLPLIVISYFCDINKPIHFNKSGVVCIYRKNQSTETN